MKSKSHGDKLEVKTSCRGQLVIYQRTTASRVPSELACAETVRKRSVQLSEMQHDLSGGTVKSVHMQEVAGLKRLTQDEQDDLLRDAGLKSNSPEVGTLLVIKADLALPWNRLRKLKTWLKSFGVQLESERTARAFIINNIL